MEYIIKNFIDEVNPNLFQSILNYSTNKLIYFDSKKTLHAIHNGQRKLFYSLLKFISIINKDNYDLLYIGAAPGRNIAEIAKIFPNIRFHLFDKFKSNDIDYITSLKLSNIIIYNKYFEDSDVENFKNVYLFSDIRTLSFTNDENIILSDLELQKKFVLDINPIMYCLKFRIPYNQNKINYFDGLCFIQPFTKHLSNEVRLYGSSRNEKKYYLKEHEMKMFYINLILREWLFINNLCYNEYLEMDLANKLNMTFVDYKKHVLSFTNNAAQVKHSNSFEFIKNLNYKYDGINVFRCKNKNVNPFFKLIDTSKKFNEKLFIKSVTHSSVNSNNNYEIFEYIGDRVLNAFISDYIIHNFEYDIMLYSGILSLFSSGEFATLVFSYYLDLDKLLITNNNKVNKQLEDILESILGFIKKEYGLKDAKTIVFNLLDKINFEEYINNIYPPKSELKEFFDKKVKDGLEEYKFVENYHVNSGNISYDEWTETEFTISLNIPSREKLIYKDFGTLKNVEIKAVDYFFEYLEKNDIYHRKKNITIIKKKVIEDKEPIKNEILTKFFDLITNEGDLHHDRIEYFKKKSNIKINTDMLIFHGDRILKLSISDFIETTYKGTVKLFNGIIATLLTEDIFDKDIKLLLALVDKIFNEEYELLGLKQCYVIVKNILDNIDLNEDRYKNKILPPKTVLLEILKYYNDNKNTNYYTIQFNKENGDFVVNLNMSSFNIASPSYKNKIYDITLKTELQKKYEFEACIQFLKYLINRGYIGNPFTTNYTIIRKQ